MRKINRWIDRLGMSNGLVGKNLNLEQQMLIKGIDSLAYKQIGRQMNNWIDRLSNNLI